ncbi:hypothetical protein AURDEDRAFT_170777 [Auricularia subglabra TFB-10046 SS5]|uniref:Uncharacterized protein n=1 Tax=Auricularia subglabra (strain TFB-10046 / SS5) TaxID=717982 RepID=J0WWM0_AURST|nr:hypothetical protein AURDEDRAFT_170777 [Auricularia subglabra TFB-10046 SS5]
MNLTSTLLYRVLGGRVSISTLFEYVLIYTHVHRAFPYVDATLQAFCGEMIFSLFYLSQRSEGIDCAASEVEEGLARAAELYRDCKSLRQRFRVSMQFARVGTKIRQSFSKPERILDCFEI